MLRTRLPALLLAAALPLTASIVARESPEVYPVCYGPQPIAPVQVPAGSLGNVSTYRPATAWSGREFGMSWVEFGNRLAFASYYADGTQRNFVYSATGLSAISATSIDMVWDGAQYGVALAGRIAADPVDVIYLVRLTRDGVMIGSPLAVSSVGATPTAAAANPAITSNGGKFAVVWNDARSGNQDIYATVISGAGAVTSADRLLSAGPAAGDQVMPAIAPTYFYTGANPLALVAWQDGRSGTKQEIYTVSFNMGTGNIGSGPFQVVSPATGNAVTPALATRANGAELTWVDSRDGNTEIYAAALYDHGFRFGPDTRLTNDGAQSDQPRILWIGGEYEVIWRDSRVASDLFWQRVGDDGVAVGGNLRLSAMGIASSPAVAWNGVTFALASMKYGWSTMQFGFYGCAADYTPPSCAGNYMAYGITGNNASISWSPAADADSGVAYYQVYRNNAPLAKTSDTFFNDSGLNLSTTYNYYVQPVNGYQLQNGSCTASIFLKTNASLTLTMDKTAPDARLQWNDIGWNNYNVFRGTDPRVMQQVGQTAATVTTDPNALADAVSYFYTVDDPGS